MRVPPLSVALIAAIPWLGAAAPPAAAQAPDPAAPPAGTTMAPHPADASWWLSGQLNVIGQAHAAFPAAYSGPNSLRDDAEQAISRVWTIDTGVRLSRAVDVWCDIESAGGRGISDALGLAGFTNLDVVRNPALGATPYVARALVHVTLPVGDGTSSAARRPWTFGDRAPDRRLEIRAGKMSLADYFDANSVGSDSHLQFTNWTIDNDGAYDYAADTRGYTYAVLVEYDSPAWSIRGAEALMPTVANGIHLDGDLGRAGADNLELELRPIAGLTVRLLGYRNRADMGTYEDAIAAFLRGDTPRPDVVSTRAPGRVKDGGGLNVEYGAGVVRVFGRAGANEGRHESFAYTEVDNTVVVGGDVDGRAWRRDHDRAGVALASNGISAGHQAYLALGGLGFLLGDGALTYGRETILEAYYTAHVSRGLFASIDAQHVANPGYNRARGPVTVGGIRLHIDF